MSEKKIFQPFVSPQSKRQSLPLNPYYGEAC